MHRSLFFVFAWCLVACAGLPSPESQHQAERRVLESLKHELGALELGRRTRSEVAAFATNQAQNVAPPVEKTVYLQGAFRLYALDGKMDDAIAVLRRQRDVLPDYSLAECVKQIEGILPLLSKDRSSRLRRLKDGLQLRIRYRQELPELLEKVRTNPLDADLNIELAHHYAVLDEWEKAFEAFVASGRFDESNGILGFSVTEFSETPDTRALSAEGFDRIEKGMNSKHWGSLVLTARRVNYCPQMGRNMDIGLVADFWWTYADGLPLGLRDCFRAFAGQFRREAESEARSGSVHEDLSWPRPRYFYEDILRSLGRTCQISKMPQTCTETDDVEYLLNEKGKIRFVHDLCSQARLKGALEKLFPEVGKSRNPDLSVSSFVPTEYGDAAWRENSLGTVSRVENALQKMEKFERGKHQTDCMFLPYPMSGEVISSTNDSIMITLKREILPGEIVFFPMLRNGYSCPVVFSGEPGWDIARFEKHIANGLFSYRIPVALLPDSKYGLYILHDGKYEEYEFTTEEGDVDVGRTIREIMSSLAKISEGKSICRSLVTQWLWQLVMEDQPSNREGLFYPVENVSWNDCQTFIEKLNGLEEVRQQKIVFQFPLEADLKSLNSDDNKLACPKWIWCRDAEAGRSVLSYKGLHRSLRAPDFKAHYTGLVLTVIECDTEK